MTRRLSDSLKNGRDYARRVIAHAPGLFASGVVLGLAAGLLEGAGLFMLVPLLSLLGLGGAAPEASAAAAMMRHVLAAIGIAPSLAGLLAIFMLLTLLRGTVLWFLADVMARLSNGFLVALRTSTIRALGEADWLHLLRRRTADQFHALTAQAERASDGAAILLRLITFAFSAAVGLAVALSTAPRLTVATLLAAAIIALPMTWFDLRAYRMGARVLDAMQALYEQLSRHLPGLKAARVMGMEQRFISDFERLASAHGEARMALARNAAATGVIHGIASAAVLCILIYLAVSGGVPGVEPIVLAIVFARLLPRAQQAQFEVQDLLAMLPHYESLNALAGSARDAREASGQVRPDVRLSHRLDLRDVSFSYEAGGPSVLKDLSLSIAVPHAVGIIGMSGAGKTTLADIVSGLLPPTGGVLLVDGSPLSRDMLPAWRRRVAYVTQEDFLFNGTVRDNLSGQSPQASDDAIWQGLERAHASALVRDLPQGLDTSIGEQGTRLSRGQRQRLCLARALMAKPDLIILDEATSALNPVDESLIRDALHEVAKTAAVVIIAHRLSSLAWTNRILVMAQGRIVEDGAPQALLRNPDSLVHAMAALERIGRPDELAP